MMRLFFPKTYKERLRKQKEKYHNRKVAEFYAKLVEYLREDNVYINPHFVDEDEDKQDVKILSQPK